MKLLSPLAPRPPRYPSGVISLLTHSHAINKPPYLDFRQQMMINFKLKLTICKYTTDRIGIGGKLNYSSQIADLSPHVQLSIHKALRYMFISTYDEESQCLPTSEPGHSRNLGRGTSNL
jgi:hypothetical protein